MMLLQLHPDMPGHWGLYERFERRCRDFGEESGWPLNPAHFSEMRQRFIATPKMAGYFLTDTLDAHLLSWCLSNYGRIGVLVYQCAGEPGQIAPLLANFFEVALPGWINSIEIAAKRPVEFLELNIDAAREPAWTRVLERHRTVTARRTMTVLNLEAKSHSKSATNGAVQ